MLSVRPRKNLQMAYEALIQYSEYKANIWKSIRWNKKTSRVPCLSLNLRTTLSVSRCFFIFLPTDASDGFTHVSSQCQMALLKAQKQVISLHPAV